MSLLRAKYERIKRHWTQLELSRRSGVRQETIYLIETGRLTPTDEQLLRLANALLVTPPSVLLQPTVLKDEAEAVAHVAANSRDDEEQVNVGA